MTGTSGIRTRAQAETLAEAGVTEIAGYAGGRTRRVCFEPREGGDIAARIFETDVVTWHPDGSITVATGGYNTPSTFDGIAAALGIDRARVGTVKKVPYVNGHNLSTGRATLTAAEVTA